MQNTSLIDAPMLRPSRGGRYPSGTDAKSPNGSLGFQTGPVPPEDEMGEMALAQRAANFAIVQALGEALHEKRKEAMEYRSRCGIEQDWEEDEEFYQSIDKSNPEGETNVSKPVSSEGGPIGLQQRNAPPRSTAFIPITRAYVDAASARVADMLLPTDDSPWSLKATPIPEANPMSPIGAAAAAVAGNGPMPEGAVYQPGMAVPPMDPTAASAMGMSPEAAAAPAPFSMPMGQAPAGQANPNDMTPEEEAADKATKIITDWHIECQWHAEVRKVIEDAALLGSGVLKGPFPMVKVMQKYTRGPDGVGRIERIIEVKPVSKRINPRNFWYDPAAGENVQNGSYTWEYDQIGARTLRRFKQEDGYILENINKVLKEGPQKPGATINAPQASRTDYRVEIGQTYPVWYFYGDLDRETLVAAGIPEEDFPDDGDVAIPAMITMVNDTVIKAALNPLDNGGFPYDVMPWQRRTGLVWGKGVARQMRTAQRMLNAGVRSMMDNGGLTSGPIWAIRRKWIKPLDGHNHLTPRKGFEMTEDAPATAKIQDAISFTNIESNINEMKLIVEQALKFAEDATGLPMLLQGQQGSAPDTVGGMTILNNNGSTVLRRIARTFDDHVTEPHIRRYYYWLLENPGNDDAKGDFQIDARGSTALLDRDLQNQALNKMTPYLASHPFVDPAKLLEEVLKSNRLDPRRIMLTEQQIEERKKAPAAPPVPVLVQQERNKGAQTIEQMRQEGASADRKIDEGKLEIEWQSIMGDLALRHGISKDEMQNSLAELVMKLNTQVALSNADKQHQHNTAAADFARNQALAPPTEPAGRAPNGEAFQA